MDYNDEQIGRGHQKMIYEPESISDDWQEPNLTLEEWEALDKRLLEEGYYSVFDEVIELENEELRYWYLFHMFNDVDKKTLHSLHEEAKEDVRKSRVLYGHPVPEDEFFDLETPKPEKKSKEANSEESV